MGRVHACCGYTSNVFLKPNVPKFKDHDATAGVLRSFPSSLKSRTEINICGIRHYRNNPTFQKSQMERLERETERKEREVTMEKEWNIWVLGGNDVHGELETGMEGV